MRLALLALVLAACSSSSPSAGADAGADGPLPCDVGGTVNGSWQPDFGPPQMFGAVTAVETWDSDTTGSVVQHLTISDGSWQLEIRQGSPASSALVLWIGGGGGDGGVAPMGPGDFTRNGESCVMGSFTAHLDQGTLAGTYRGPHLGLNPPRP